MNLKKDLVSFLLDTAQYFNNKLYEKEGLSDRVLDNQVQINMYRNEYDLSDPNTVLDNGFVQ